MPIVFLYETSEDIELGNVENLDNSLKSNELVSGECEEYIGWLIIRSVISEASSSSSSSCNHFLWISYGSSWQFSWILDGPFRGESIS